MSDPLALDLVPSRVLLTPDEAARALALSARTLRRRTDAGDIPGAVKIGRSIRYRLADLHAFVNGLPAPHGANTVPR
ncbi:helix-turn-helix transcriptional regulator [Alienimonas chondri]|uniref:Helix-turn-helix domain-containing protein n=1 Tax=Alienimonas chondri TaxID=2681879 RepID=A0ABX1VED3_9PLAN|nr:hypothetical protein [Alienimonas chondri]